MVSDGKKTEKKQKQRRHIQTGSEEKFTEGDQVQTIKILGTHK